MPFQQIDYREISSLANQRVVVQRCNQQVFGFVIRSSDDCGRRESQGKTQESHEDVLFSETRGL